MRMLAFRNKAVGGYAAVRLVALAISAGLLAGCGAGGVTSSEGAVGQFFKASTAETKEIDPELLRPDRVCPQVRVQPRTESLRKDDGSGDRTKLNWQASITKTARECKLLADGTGVRVGIAGRVIEGPAGAPEKLELPVRVAVRGADGDVIYSRLHKVAVTRSAASQDWAIVDEAIVVDNPASVEIIVGFDG